MSKKPAQIGLVGAVQRAAPAIAELWLDWVGIPDLSSCEFRVVGDQRHAVPHSSIFVTSSAEDLEATRELICDYLDIPADAPERKLMPIVVPEDSPSHGVFWARVLRRDAHDVQSPLEFWWTLSIIRHGGPLRASAAFLRALGLKQSRGVFRHALVDINNPSFNPKTRTASLAVEKTYEIPESVDVYLSLDISGKHIPRDQAVISIPLDDKNTDRVYSAMISVALAETI